MTKCLREVHLRVHVVLRMLDELIARGFPGYKGYRMEDIQRRAREGAAGRQHEHLKEERQ